MGGYYDEVEIEDMSWDEEKGVYHYPCPCGDRFEITKRQLADYEDIATCPSCSLIIRVIYDPLEFEDYASDEDVNGDGQSGGGDEDEEGDNTDATSQDEAKDEKIVDALNKLDITQDNRPPIVSTVLSVDA